MGTYSVIGKPLPDVDISKKASGAAVYAADIKLPGMHYGKILRSRYPHARILNINASKAKRLPGVKAVITGKDIPPTHWGVVIKDNYAFAVDKVRYVGDEVAGVSAGVKMNQTALPGFTRL